MTIVALYRSYLNYIIVIVIVMVLGYMPKVAMGSRLIYCSHKTVYVSENNIYFFLFLFLFIICKLKIRTRSIDPVTNCC